MQRGDISAVLLAAGKGVRFKSGIPKVMHYLIDRPMIYYPVRALIRSGIKDIIVVLGFGAETVREYLTNEFGDIKLKFVYQRVQRGTGDAVKIALSSVKASKFILLYGDMPLIDETVITELLQFSKGSELLLTTFTHNNPEGYGRVIRDKDDNLLKIVEHKDASDAERQVLEVNAGLYLCNTNIVKRYISRISNKNVQKEYYFTDIFKIAINEHIPIRIFESNIDYLLGSNNRLELSNLTKTLQRRINERLMLSGVSIIEPDSVFVGIDVQIDRDTTIYPNVFISGRSVIGRNVRIENGAIIQNSQIGDSVHIKPYSHIEKAVIKRGAIIGPFARLRPDSVVDEDAHIGNFVELKKTYMGKRSKANHLTYLGDADIGSGVNIGAGTITCNYDGVNKYKTILEDGVFVGSDTQFVAPVKVGKNAYIGAGSTITEDVPEESLALSRTPQKNIKGWVKKRKRGR